MTTKIKGVLSVALIGLLFGFSLGIIGFSDWDEVHGMFTFSSLRLLLTFMCGAALLAAAWPLATRLFPGKVFARRIHRGTFPGGVLFGAGWAISGACPAIAMVQLGEGQLGAIATLAGMFVGNYTYAYVHQRWLKWDADSCAPN